MKSIFYFLVGVTFIFSACNSERSGNESFSKKKGDEDPLVQRYMSELIANPTTQDHIDRNLIVNMLMDSLWDFQKTDSGIYYHIEEPGTGPFPNLNSNIICHYRGTLLDGREFDSSFKRGTPLKFKLGGVIAGWQETIPLLRIGGKGTFIIPSRLAYGPQAASPLIGANSVLKFEVELLSFR